MSLQEVERLTKAELKNKLVQMGMSLDRNDHPKDYYVQLYLEKTNTKNKITRDNTPFYKNILLRGKRERESKRERKREKRKDKELIEDPNYEEEEYEEEEEYNDVDEDEDYIYEEEEEEISDNVEKEKNRTKRKKRSKKTIDERYNDYRESGIKITRLIKKKKERMLKNKKVLFENPNQKFKCGQGSRLWQVYQARPP